MFRDLLVDCIFTDVDIEEPMSDADTVASYKATQLGVGVICDDLILEVEGFDFGVDVKFKLKQLIELSRSYTLKDVPFENLPNAIMECRLSYYDGRAVNIFKGVVKGKIIHNEKCVRPDQLFVSNHNQKYVSARVIACSKLLSNDYYTVDPVFEWTGDFQM